MSNETLDHNYKPIQALLNKKFKPDPKRWEKLPQIDPIIYGGGVIGFSGFDYDPLHLMAAYAGQGMMLDAGCGITFGQNMFGRYSSLVDNFPSAYGIDLYFDAAKLPEYQDKVIRGRVEHMPFHDQQFKFAATYRALGFYTGVAFDPYWSVSEMIRVTQKRGIILIQIGSGNYSDPLQNACKLLLALEEVQKRDKKIGRRIESIHDNTDQRFSHLLIQLKS